MLIEIGALLVTYSSLRVFEKIKAHSIKTKKAVIQSNDKKNKMTLLDKIDNTNNKALSKNEIDQNIRSRLNSSYLSLGVSTLRQFFYSSPPIIFLNLSLYIYNAVPYLKESETTLLEERKLSGQMIDTILIMAAIATNQYFAASIIEVVYYYSGKVKAKTQDKSKDMLVNVFEEQPRHVWILKDKIEIEMPLESVQINDIVVVNTGEVIPVDGIIVKGLATIDQQALTGESQPAEMCVGDHVFAATTLITGQIQIQIEKAGVDTTIAQIGQILNQTTDFKTTIQLKAEQWADQAAWPQLLISGIGLLALGPMAATSLLNTNFGYRIKLSGPVGTLSCLNLASQHRILIKDGRSLELLTGIDTVLFDKTGTLTQEQPDVGNIIVCSTYKADEILAYAAVAEHKLAHPIAKAIVQKAKDFHLDLSNLTDIADANYQLGYGITVTIKDLVIKVGSLRFMTMEGMIIPKVIKEAMDHSHSQGYSMIMVAINHQIEGAIEIRPALRPEIKEIINGLRQRGIQYLAIVSGDQKQPTQRLAEELGMDDYFYDVLPENKAEIVERLQQEGKSVCFIGDGVNDVIAMKKANVSISIRGATSIATDLAQIVFMDGSLSHLCKLFDLANDLNRQLQKSLVISLIPLPINFVGIFFLHMGLIPVILVNQISFWGGLGNAMKPSKRIDQ